MNPITRSSGDVFRDLGFNQSEAEELRLRSDLMIRLREVIAGLHLSQSAVATRLGVRQPRVSDLLRGKIHLFSVEMLTAMLSRLGAHVSVYVDDFFISGERITTARVWATATNAPVVVTACRPSEEATAAVDSQLAMVA
jgi:predicted XRE-type DNA-binding protein